MCGWMDGCVDVMHDAVGVALIPELVVVGARLPPTWQGNDGGRLPPNWQGHDMAAPLPSEASRAQHSLRVLLDPGAALMLPLLQHVLVSRLEK
jgi:hypothetical protein